MTVWSASQGWVVREICPVRTHPASSASVTAVLRIGWSPVVVEGLGWSQ
jgi:hypothetical protein